MKNTKPRKRVRATAGEQLPAARDNGEVRRAALEDETNVTDAGARPLVEAVSKQTNIKTGKISSSRETKAKPEGGRSSRAPNIDQGTMLSIVVPVSRRTHQVDRLVRELQEAIANAQASNTIEIVLCPMRDAARAFDGQTELFKGLRVVLVDSALSTVDLVTLALLPSLRGAYVWVIEIGDVLLPRGLNKLLPLLDLQRPRIVLLNPLLRSSTDWAPVPLLPDLASEEVTCLKTFQEYVLKFGLTGPLAIPGSIVFPRTRVMALNWKQFAVYSPVYTCSAVVTAACWRLTVTTVSSNVLVKEHIGPLHTDSGTSRIFGDSAVFSDAYFDTIGLLGLISQVEARVNTHGLVSRIHDYLGSSTRPLSIKILESMCDQIAGDIEMLRVHRGLTMAELRLFADLCSLFDSTFGRMAERLERVARITIPLIASLCIDPSSKPALPTRLTRELEMLPESSRETIWMEIRGWALDEIKEIRYALINPASSGFSIFDTSGNMPEAGGHGGDFVHQLTRSK